MNLPIPRKLIVLGDEYTGKGSAEKRAAIAEWLTERKLDGAILSALDSVAWAFNIRGSDVSRTPVALSFAVINDDGTADFYVEPDKVTDEVRQHLGNAVRLHPRTAFAPALEAMQTRAPCAATAPCSPADPTARWCARWSSRPVRARRARRSSPRRA